jgi:hypothetical protein
MYDKSFHKPFHAHYMDGVFSQVGRQGLEP